MKTYTDRGNFITIENSWIPKNSDNRYYQQFLEEQKNGEAKLIPHVPFAPTWNEIRSKRDDLLKESDWVGLRDVTITNEQAWLDYRQALRDIPQNFIAPESIIWPIKPV